MKEVRKLNVLTRFVTFLSLLFFLCSPFCRLANHVILIVVIRRLHILTLNGNQTEWKSADEQRSVKRLEDVNYYRQNVIHRFDNVPKPLSS